MLDRDYDVLGVDYFWNFINMCNSLSNNKYMNFFKQFDIMKDELDRKFKYIYSIVLLHMFVTGEHRKLFFKFIREHLTDDGVALICVLGDGEFEYSSDVTKAFDNSKIVVMNEGVSMLVATTTCRVVNWNSLEKEINDSDLKVEEKWISKSIPEFSCSMCVVVSK